MDFGYSHHAHTEYSSYNNLEFHAHLEIRDDVGRKDDNEDICGNVDGSKGLPILNLFINTLVMHT